MDPHWESSRAPPTLLSIQRASSAFARSLQGPSSSAQTSSVAGESSALRSGQDDLRRKVQETYRMYRPQEFSAPVERSGSARPSNECFSLSNGVAAGVSGEPLAGRLEKRDTSADSPDAVSSLHGEGGNASGVPPSDLPPGVLEIQSAHRLLHRYRMDNDRLRSQLAAADLRQQWLTQRMEHLIRTTRPLIGESQKTEAVEHTAPAEEHRRYIHSLEAQVSELTGRLRAFEEQHRREQQTSAADDDMETLEGNSSEKEESLTTTEALRACWGLSSYLVKVFNAVLHIRSTPHRLTADSIDPEASGAPQRDSLCPHPVAYCTDLCLRAALRGSQLEQHHAALRAASPPLSVVANAVLEELAYCERLAVQLAGGLLATHRSSPFVEEPIDLSNATVDRPVQLSLSRTSSSGSYERQSSSSSLLSAADSAERGRRTAAVSTPVQAMATANGTSVAPPAVIAPQLRRSAPAVRSKPLNGRERQTRDGVRLEREDCAVQ